MSQKKGIYIDGHECEDVGRIALSFWMKFTSYKRTIILAPCAVSDESPPEPSLLVPQVSNDIFFAAIHHDESISIRKRLRHGNGASRVQS